MTEIREENLVLRFGDSWRVLKYDANGSFYRTALANRMARTKAVDLLCLRDDAPLLMVEVKDFGSGVPDLEKFSAIPQKIAQKIRDTLAGIVGGSYTAEAHEKRFFGESLRRMASPPRFIYLFEDIANARAKADSAGGGEKGYAAERIGKPACDG